MARLNIDISEGLRSRAAARARQDGFSSVEQYVQALLLGDAAGGPALDEVQIRKLLLDRLDGPFVDADRADFRRIRKKLQTRLSRSRGAGNSAGLRS